MKRRVYTVEIDTEYIMKIMEQEGVSIRKLAGRIGISDRQLRDYLERASCPPFILGKICQEIPVCAKYALKGMSLWMRLGVTVPVTYEELEKLMLERDSIGADVDIGDGLANEFLRRAVVDGDSYIPFSCLEEGG